MYTRRVGDGHVLVGRNLDTGNEQILTDLRGDGSGGWEIWGHSLSPDRRRIALASLYGPTAEDNASGLATRRIWTLDVDGTDFQRLTPVFPNSSQGRSSYSLDVSNPMWSADGSKVVYTLSEYWYQNNQLSGGTAPWVVAANGNSPPTNYPSQFGCAIVAYPSRNPATGEMLFLHSVCLPGSSGDGLFLYPPNGGSEPRRVLASSRVSGGVDVFLASPSWVVDGTGFVFVGSTEATDWRPSVMLYNLENDTYSTLVPAPVGAAVWGAAISPTAKKLVYCLHQDSGERDLHYLDLTAQTITDVALTNDGKSCDPAF